MANPARGEVGLMVGGKAYTLRPTFDALCELEDLVGKPLHTLMAGIQEGRLSGLRAVVWCFLQDEHAREIITLKDASQWIERAGGADAVNDAIQRALGINAPDEPQQEPPQTTDPSTAQADGTGEPYSSVLVGSV
jgi:hypothetical protein